MTNFVLDASVTLAWGFEDETSPYAEAAISSLGISRATVPAIWPIEVNNALLSAVRRGRLQLAAATRLISTLNHMAIDVDVRGSHVAVGQRILELGLSAGISSYDASYLELALRRGLPLATQDARLTVAADHAGVEILRP